MRTCRQPPHRLPAARPGPRAGRCPAGGPHPREALPAPGERGTAARWPRGGAGTPVSRHPVPTWTLRVLRAAQLAMLLAFVAYFVSVQVNAAAYLAGPTGHASWLWLFFFFAVITLGELYLSPIGLALVARVAPPSILSAMMGLWFITSFTGNLLQGYIGSFFSEMDKIHFFLLCAGIGGVAAVITWLFDRLYSWWESVLGV